MQIEPLLQPRRVRDQVQDLIREMILSGALASGQRLEEVELAERVGVSRTPLREALISLEQEGWVRSRPNRGFAVVPANDVLVREIYPIMAALESAVVREGGDRVREIVPELGALNARLATETQRARQYALDLRFHQLIASAAPSVRMTELIESHRRLAQRFDGAFARGTANHEGSCREHAAIVAALEEDDFENASRLLWTHWHGGIEVVIRWLGEHS